MITSPKRIVWLLHEPQISGANIAALEYAQQLRNNYAIHFILPHSGKLESVLKEKKFDFTIIPQYNWAGTARKGLNRIRYWLRTKMAVAQTKKLIKDVKANIVFTNTIVPFTASLAASAIGLPHVWWVHEFGEEDFGFSIGNGNKQMAYRQIQKSKLVICNSNAVCKKYQSVLPRADVRTLYQPVSSKQTPGSVQRNDAYLMFGQITPSKGHLEVLQALAFNKEQGKHVAKLIIKGPCENKYYFHQLLSFAKKHQLENYVSVEEGFFNNDETITSCKALIVASSAEAFGRVIMEAVKANVKVIVKNSGGAPELINESNGILYHSFEELTDILAGNIALPTIQSTSVYDESSEINKLKDWLLNIQ